MASRPKTIAYIDGFNLYYGAVKNTSYTWLDLYEFCQRICPANDIIKVYYFTARIKAYPKDPGGPARQQIFLRALQAHRPNVEIVLGRFQQNRTIMPLADGSGFARVYKTEEKGSDVNLAVHMLNDAHLRRTEAAVVLSNDSDLAEAIRLVKQTGIPVGLINPQIFNTFGPSVHLRKLASFRLGFSEADLAACQLPNPIPGTKLHKPDGW